jgi:predicted site-specific integrase-resolvase
VNTTSISIPEGRAILSLHRFCREAGISDTTAWRWRRKGWLTTINIAGRQYITDRALSEFLPRAEAGEFAAACKIPARKT